MSVNCELSRFERISAEPAYPEPSNDALAEWTAIVNLLAEVTRVEAALVMRGNEDSMEVMAASEQVETPYEPGEEAPREGRLYCETVIETQEPLCVVDAFNDPVWQGNPDTELGLASYYGLPVNWPDGTPFGTICILSREPRSPTEIDRKLMERLRSLIELSLKVLVADQQLTYVATHDPLTGLMNRVLFESVADQYMHMAKRQEGRLWMMYWDLDHFKTVNDRFGHAAGDRLLAALGREISGALRRNDAPARLGGEEFAALLFGANRDQVQVVVRRLMDAIARAGETALPEAGPITMSCGIAEYRADDDLIGWTVKADRLMYQAKREGRNRFVIENPPAGKAKAPSR